MRTYVHGLIYLGLVFGRGRIDIETNIDGRSGTIRPGRAPSATSTRASIEPGASRQRCGSGRRQRDAALDFRAHMRAYDSYLEDWARHHAPRNGAGRLLARHALPLREGVADFEMGPDLNDAHAVFDALTRADDVAACCARTPRFSVRERAGLPGRGRRVGWDDDAPPRITFLEQQCAPRHRARAGEHKVPGRVCV